ncbi:uncharacterized protein [Antedon mediterranea]|uniref:uncharacterized protein isoform X2 n=1 Tax=Antedon mediterranea TaxID=105859 RepID=UPI003AF965A6
MASEKCNEEEIDFESDKNFVFIKIEEKDNDEENIRRQVCLESVDILKNPHDHDLYSLNTTAMQEDVEQTSQKHVLSSGDVLETEQNSQVLSSDDMQVKEEHKSLPPVLSSKGMEEQEEQGTLKQFLSSTSNVKRVRRFQMKWKLKYPWIDYIGDYDLINGVMICTICREYRKHADQNSNFLNGTSTFRLGAIDAHNISKGHKKCIAMKLMETVDQGTAIENLLKMNQERSARIRLQRNERRKNRRKKIAGLIDGLVNGSMVSCDKPAVSNVTIQCDKKSNNISDNNLKRESPPMEIQKQTLPTSLPDTSHSFTPPKKPRLVDYERNRIRRFQSTWQLEFPWLDYLGDPDRHNGVMYCKICRLFPEIADQSSKFFSGTSSFRRGGIESHNISVAHRACLCRKNAHESMNTDPTEEYVDNQSRRFVRKTTENATNEIINDLPSISNQPTYTEVIGLHENSFIPEDGFDQVLFQNDWTSLFPWVAYTGSRSTSDVYCRICRLHPHDADINSKLFKGTKIVQKRLLQLHSESASHILCVAKQFFDESLGDYNFHSPLPINHSSSNSCTPLKLSSSNHSSEILSRNQTSLNFLSYSPTTSHSLLQCQTYSEPALHIPQAPNQISADFPLPQTEINCKPYTPMCRRYNEKRKLLESSSHQSNLSHQRSHAAALETTSWQPQEETKTEEFCNVSTWKSEFVWLDFDCGSGVMTCKLCQCYPMDASTSEFLKGSKHFSRDHLVQHAKSNGHRAAVCRNFLAILAKQNTNPEMENDKVTYNDLPEEQGHRQMIKRAASMEEFNKMRDKAKSAIDDSAADLNTISQEIWSNPELAYEEHHAHKILTNFLEKQGFEVERKYILDTAFRATWGTDGGVTIGVICEYDALPGIGHACGHNLIAECGVATAIGIKAALEMNLVKDLKAKIVVLGTPAEEGGGGKCQMIERGAFDGLDVAMMAHPYAHNVSRPKALSMLELKISYHGKSAHAAAAPWEGVNALDAAVACYSNLSNLRQQMKPDWRIHGIITNGGLQANIIPDKAELSYYLRAPDEENLALLKEKAVACIEGAAKSTGCQVEIKQQIHYKNLLTNSALISLYEKYASNLGVHFGESNFTHGSTDMGNVTYVLPGIHPKFDIVTNAPNHSTKFTEASGTAAAQGPTLIQAKALALTGLEIIHSGNEGVLSTIRKEFEDTIRPQ